MLVLSGNPEINIEGCAGLSTFIARLRTHTSFSIQEEQALQNISAHIVDVMARREITPPEDLQRHVLLVSHGTLGRFNMRTDGVRQFSAIYLPGEACNLSIVAYPVDDGRVTAITRATVAYIPVAELKQIAEQFSNIALAFWRETSRDAMSLARMVAVLGRKDARSRVAHLLCEIGTRLERAGQGSREAYRLALTQEQLGEATGLTGVHVNRVLRQLREDGLVMIKEQRVSISDWDALSSASAFLPRPKSNPYEQLNRGCLPGSSLRWADLDGISGTRWPTSAV